MRSEAKENRVASIAAQTSTNSKPSPGWRLLLTGALLILTACSNREHNFIIYHHYTGKPAHLLARRLRAWCSRRGNVTISMLYKSWQELEEAMRRSRSSALPALGDAWIIAHDRIGQLAEAGLIHSLKHYIKSRARHYRPEALRAVRYRGTCYALPLSLECVCLLYNRALVKEPPATVEELARMAPRFLHPQRDRYLLLFPIHIPYFTLPWVQACGGTSLRRMSVSPAVTRNQVAFRRAGRLLRDRLRIPWFEELQIMEKFAEKQVPFVISGPWSVSGLAARGLDFGVAPLPRLNREQDIVPFLGVQCLVINARIKGEAMRELAALFDYLRRSGFSRDLSLLTKSVSPLLEDDMDPDIRHDPFINTFAEQARLAQPMPNDPEIARLWDRLNQATMKRLLGGNEPVAPILRRLAQENNDTGK